MLFASDVKFDSNKTKDPLSAIAQKRQGALSDALGRLRGISSKSSTASGRSQGSYTGQEMGRASSLASRGLNDTLYGLLGNATYSDKKSALDHARNMELVRQIGSSMSPSLAQEIMGGIGGAANLGFTGLGIYNSLPKTPSYGANPALGTGQNPYGYDLTSMQGYKPYDYRNNWGG